MGRAERKGENMNISGVRGAVARGWCAEANSHKEMDVDLAEAISQEVWAYLSTLELEIEEFKKAANLLIDYCIDHEWGMMPEPYDSINPLLKLLRR
jgi:hypothetical protein